MKVMKVTISCVTDQDSGDISIIAESQHPFTVVAHFDGARVPVSSTRKVSGTYVAEWSAEQVSVFTVEVTNG